MARHARLMLAEIPVHIIQRGHNHAACFFAKADYRFYLEQIGILAPGFGCAVHAYCLMPNHVHLLLTPATVEACGQFMKQLAQRHTQHINRTYRRHGTLWDGRFRSCLLDAEPYLLACQRYVELNPVRAGMVARPAEHPWSSHPANATGQPAPPLSPAAPYLRLGNDAAARGAAYAALFEAAADMAQIQAIRDATNGGYVLGDAGFQGELGARLGRRVARGKPGRPRKQPVARENAPSPLAGEGGGGGSLDSLP